MISRWLGVFFLALAAASFMATSADAQKRCAVQQAGKGCHWDERSRTCICP